MICRVFLETDTAADSRYRISIMLVVHSITSILSTWPKNDLFGYGVMTCVECYIQSWNGSFFKATWGVFGIVGERWK